MNTEFLTKLKHITNSAAVKLSQFPEMVESSQNYIIDHFGTNGLYAAYIALAALLIFAAIQLTRIAFSTMKYLVVPALALALAGSFFLPYSFPALLPASVTLCSVVLLFKG